MLDVKTIEIGDVILSKRLPDNIYTERVLNTKGLADPDPRFQVVVLICEREGEILLPRFSGIDYTYTDEIIKILSEKEKSELERKIKALRALEL